MKNIFFLLSTVVFIVSPGCREAGPNINLSGNGVDTTGGGSVDSTQQKNVLLEDFTATNCPNCPKAREISDDLVASYPGRVIVVSVNQGILSVPMLPGDPVLKTQDGEDLAAFLGPPPFWPVGAVDRVAFEIAPDDFEVLVDRGFWSTYVPQELDSTLKVKLGISTNYDDASRLLTGSVTVNFLETISDPLSLTVLITESGIIAGQIDGVILDTFYVHRDVMRDIITNYAGNSITGDQSGGSLWTYNISAYHVGDDWNADSCRIVAFVSRATGSYQVLQVIEESLK